MRLHNNNYYFQIDIYILLKRECTLIRHKFFSNGIICDYINILIIYNIYFCNPVRKIKKMLKFNLQIYICPFKLSCLEKFLLKKTQIKSLFFWWRFFSHFGCLQY